LKYTATASIDTLSLHDALPIFPGTVGAAPMQNIGAYGVEIREVISSVEAVEIKTGELRTFTPEQCAFGYRESVFKQHLKDQYFIDRKSTRLNSSHVKISYAVFC